MGTLIRNDKVAPYKGVGMKNKLFVNISMICLTGILLMGCGSDKTELSANKNVETVLQENKTEQPEKDSQVASKEEMAKPVEVGSKNLVAITGDKIKDGKYEIQVESSSAMFKITHCDLTVKKGKMTAEMTMSGTGYAKVFMGTGEEAVNAKEEEYIPYVENEKKEHTFTVPVEALDKEIACTAFSIRKEKWYDRTLVFSSKSLPTDAIEGTGSTVESLGLKDGNYQIEVTLEGGSGKSNVNSPAKLCIKEGKAYATITWSSSNYDYMKVDGKKIEPASREKFSVFEIPVDVFDRKFAVIADTVAMSEPHEIEYTLFFDSTTLKEK